MKRKLPHWPFAVALFLILSILAAAVLPGCSTRPARLTKLDDAPGLSPVENAASPAPTKNADEAIREGRSHRGVAGLLPGLFLLRPHMIEL